MDESRERWNHQRPQQIVEDDEINLLTYLQVVSKRKWMIILICVVAVATTAIVSLLLPEIYAATASVVPPLEILQKESGMADRFGALKSSMLSDVISVTSIGNMYADILRSRAVVDTIIDRFGLMRVYEAEYQSSAREKLRDSTAIDVSDEGIVTITVEDKDPNRAAAMANAYIDELDRQNKRLSSGQATSKKVFLESRLKEIEQELSDIEDIPAKQAEIKEMLYQLLARECELARIEVAKSMPTIQVLDEAIVPDKKAKPKRRLMVLLAGVTSLFGAVFLAFAREYVARVRQQEAQRQKAALSGHKSPGEEEGDANGRGDQDKRLQQEDTIYTRPT
jgi:uncharacterized protein involved in exopolysaccharide biosynthesis